MIKNNPDMDIIIKNEEKWREFQFKMLDDISKRVITLEIKSATLEVKIVAIAGLLGAGSGTLVTILINHFNK